jgi:hypothetical protein
VEKKYSRHANAICTDVTGYTGTRLKGLGHEIELKYTMLAAFWELSTLERPKEPNVLPMSQ